jgi:AraC-like DNA-binding protein
MRAHGLWQRRPRYVLSLMKRARTIEEFLADPVGSFTMGRTHLVWCHSPQLAGTVHWGQPSESDAAELARRLDVSIHPSLAGGFNVLMDARGMESFDLPAFGVVTDYVKSRLAEWSRRIRKHAVVVPQGVAAVFVAGLMPLVGTHHPLRFFSSMAEAMEWMDCPELLEVLDQIGPAVDEARGVSPMLRSLRAHLEANLGAATLETASQALGLSPRTLQRELQREATSFTGELMQARLRAACALLEHSDEKVDTVARRVGSASSSQLSELFRRELGETPAMYRARRRGNT